MYSRSHAAINHLGTGLFVIVFSSQKQIRRMNLRSGYFFKNEKRRVITIIFQRRDPKLTEKRHSALQYDEQFMQKYGTAAISSL
jgi:hypothetical protein